jgi:hypothetical protein
MSLYSATDIETDFDGDLVLSPVGDVSLANPLVTHKAAANFLLRTNYREYAPDESVGCNLGSFMGKMNTRENAEYMESTINTVLKTRVFNLVDVNAKVVPFDIDEVLCVITIAGLYLINDALVSVEGETIAYAFPYLEGRFSTPFNI